MLSILTNTSIPIQWLVAHLANIKFFSLGITLGDGSICCDRVARAGGLLLRASSVKFAGSLSSSRQVVTGQTIPKCRCVYQARRVKRCLSLKETTRDQYSHCVDGRQCQIVSSFAFTQEETWFAAAGVRYGTIEKKEIFFSLLRTSFESRRTGLKETPWPQNYKGKPLFFNKTCLFTLHTSTLALPISQALIYSKWLISSQRVTQLTFISCFYMQKSAFWKLCIWYTILAMNIYYG